MHYAQHLVKSYPVSTFYLVFIWVLCFMTPPHTPLDNVTLMDKWVHVAMYAGTCGTIWFEYLRRHDRVAWTRALLLAWLAPALMSGLIEVLQATCTGGRRSGDWLDFWANCVGCTVGLAIGMVLLWCRARGDRARRADGNCRNGGRR